MRTGTIGRQTRNGIPSSRLRVALSQAAQRRKKQVTTQDTLHATRGHRTCRLAARKLAALLAVSIAFATAQIPCQAIAATSVSDAKDAFDTAAQRYNDACTASEQAQQAADTANASLEQAKGNAVTSIRSTYKSGSSDAVNAIMSALCSGNVSEGIKQLAAWQSIAEWSDTNIQTLMNDKAAADQAKADADAAVSEAQTARDAAEQAYDAALKEQEEARKKAAAASSASTSSGVASVSSIVDNSGSVSGGFITVAQMKTRGVVYYNGWRFTYYSETVLPGNGLNIPGRHVSDGKVCDADGYICVASSTLPKGTIVDSPLGTGRVYDSGCAAGTLDLFVH